MPNLIVAHSADTIYLRLLSADQQLLAQEESISSLDGAAGLIKNFLSKNAGGGNLCIYILIEADPTLLRLRSEAPKSREELRASWNINSDYFAYVVTEVSESKKLYCGLQFKSESLDPYINLLKKLKFPCGGIIPLDLLYLYYRGEGIFAERRNDQLIFKLFDRNSNYYYQKLLLPPTETLLEKKLGDLITYINREKLASPEGYTLHNKYDLNFILEHFVPTLPPNLILYTEEGDTKQHKKKFKLNPWQKNLLLFCSVILVCATIFFINLFFQMLRINQDINTYQQSLAQLSPQATALKLQEERTRELRSFAGLNNLALKSFFKYLKQRNLSLTACTYDANKKLISAVLVDRAEYRNLLLKDLKTDPLFSAINLIYLKPAGKTTEFKLIIKLP